MHSQPTAAIGLPAFGIVPLLSSPAMKGMTDSEEIQRRLAQLQLEHRDLDVMIDWLLVQPRCDELQIRRLKKRKLQLKDSILYLQMLLVPDEPA